MSLEIHTGATPNGWKITIMIEELIEAGVTLPKVNSCSNPTSFVASLFYSLSLLWLAGGGNLGR